MHLSIRRALGVLALGGGFLGFNLALAFAIQSPSPLELAICSGFVLLYLLGIWSGLRLIEDRSDALALNLAYWAAQLPYIHSPLAGYAFASGAFVTPYLRLGPPEVGVGWAWRIGSEFHYSFLLATEPKLFGVNVLALAVVLYLWRLRRSAKADVAPTEP